MKVYNKVVIDMNTLEVVEEDSYEYEGEVALCKGGGGASGAVDFPTHMKTIHQSWLNHSGADNVTISIVDAMNAAFTSPFASAIAYDPDTDLSAMVTEAAAYETLIDGAISASTLNSAVAALLATTYVDTASSAFGVALNIDVNANVIPTFEAGMRDINQVMSSYFVIGKALLLEDSVVKEVAKFKAGLTAKAKIDAVMQVLEIFVRSQQAVTTVKNEARRVQIIAKGEEASANIKYAESDAKWDLEVFQYGNNVLASISGAAHYVPNKEGNSTQSAIGGAMSGAAMGMSVGGPWGAAAGAAIGLGASLL